MSSPLVQTDTATAGTAPALLGAVPLADCVAELYQAGDGMMRAQLLTCLIRPLGALALAAVAGGVFGELRSRNGWQRVQVLDEDTQRISAAEVRTLVAYLQQAAPEVLSSLGEQLSLHRADRATRERFARALASARRPNAQRTVH
jgi:hypothetical protein